MAQDGNFDLPSINPKLVEELKNAVAVIDRAMAWTHLNEYQEALNELETLPAWCDEVLDPVWMLKSECFCYFNQPEKALPYSLKLLASSPDDPDIVAKHCGLLMHLGRMDEARDGLAKAFKDHPKNANVLLEMARLCARSQQPTEARNWLDKAIVIDGSPIGPIYRTARKDWVFDEVWKLKK